jgi:hypothetical protein
MTSQRVIFAATLVLVALGLVVAIVLPAVDR